MGGVLVGEGWETHKKGISSPRTPRFPLTSFN